MQSYGYLALDLELKDIAIIEVESILKVKISHSSFAEICSFKNDKKTMKAHLCRKLSNIHPINFVPEIEDFCFQNSNIELSDKYDIWKIGVITAQLLFPGLIENSNFDNFVEVLEREIRKKYSTLNIVKEMIQFFEFCFQKVPSERKPAEILLEVIAAIIGKNKKELKNRSKENTEEIENQIIKEREKQVKDNLTKTNELISQLKQNEITEKNKTEKKKKGFFQKLFDF